MTCFSPDLGRLNIATPDPFKRVYHTLGMVLGVDDFRQEQEYHLERVRWLARDLLGYGTVRGLAVILEQEGAKGWRVHVTKGVGLSPSGQLICVPVDQCCNLNEWLAAQARDKNKRDALEGHLLGSPAALLTLYVVLSYRDCPTDNAPIPGEPCRSEDELMKPSRLKDDFCLELRYAPPPQREEDAVRDFVSWLAAIPIDDASPPMSTEDFLSELRAAANAWLATSPPLSPPSDFMFGLPQGGLRISREQLRAALRLWATELRPKWIAPYGCAPEPPLPQPQADAILLAELEVPLLQASGGWVVSDVEAVEINEDRRPFVIHLRLLQELLLQAGDGATTLPAGDAVIPEQTFGAAPSAGSSTAYSRADHTHGTPQLPDLNGDVTGPIPNSRINSIQGVNIIATGAGAGQVLTFDGARWQPENLPPAPGVNLGGDVSGPAANARVVGLRGVLIDPAPPAQGQVLTFDAGSWRAINPQVAGGGQFVGRATPRAFDIVAAGRFRIDPLPDNSERLDVKRLGGGVYNNLHSIQSTGTRFPYFITFSFNDYNVALDYVVKLTPGWLRLGNEDVTRGEFFIYFAGFSQAGFAVRLQSVTPQISISRLHAVELHIEVSRYVPD